jgi:multiple antibiotic resistance protein
MAYCLEGGWWSSCIDWIANTWNTTVSAVVESVADFDWTQMISAFIALFIVIDILGSIPIIISLKERGRKVNATQASLISFALLLAFFYAGDMMLRLFNVDIESFAVAGALVIFLMALEMILDVEIFKNQGPIKEATLVPLVFPLLAGAATFTTLLSLRASFAAVNIVIALTLNMAWVYFVIRMASPVERLLGKGGIYILRKFFGVILLAISVRLFTANITQLIEAFHK